MDVCSFTCEFLYKQVCIILYKNKSIKRFKRLRSALLTVLFSPVSSHILLIIRLIFPQPIQWLTVAPPTTVVV